MQTISFNLLIVFIFCFTIISFGQKTKQNNTLSKTKSANDKTSMLDSSFIGKTTEDKHIKKLFECWGQMISESENADDSLAICSLSTKQDNCRLGKFRILFKKMLYRTKKGAAVFEITDEIIFENHNSKLNVSIVSLKLDTDKVKKRYLIKYIDNRKEFIDKVLSIWRINFTNKNFIPVKIPSKIKCYNPDFTDE